VHRVAIDRNKVLAAAQTYVRKGQWDKALKEYRTLVEDDPNDVRNQLKCGDLYVKLNRIAEALACYKSVADYYARQDMYEKAIAVYKQALQLDTEEVRLHQALGEAYHRLGRLKDAVRSFHQAQTIYKARGEDKAQREILEYMVRIDPDDVGLRIQLAERYAKDNLVKKAVELFLTCADLLENEGRLDEFVQVSERIIFLDPERHELRKKIVRIYLNRQDNKHALKHLQICFKALPSDIEVLELLGQTFERLERADKAVLVYQELAQLYEERGRTALVQDVYRRILRLDPSNATARKALDGGRKPSVDDSDVMSGPATGSMRKQTPVTGPTTTDSLAGIEFLDDADYLNGPAPKAAPVPAVQPGGQPGVYELDMDAFDDAPRLEVKGRKAPAPAAQPAASSSRAPVAQPQSPVGLLSDSEILDLSDDLVFLEDPNPVMIDESHSIRQEIPVVDVEPINGEMTEAQVAQLLTECQVFLKYGLFDKAYGVISGAMAKAPKSIYAHEQMLALHRAMNNPDGMIEYLLKLARLTTQTPYRCYEYLSQALKVSPSPAGIYSYAESLGIDLNGPPPIDEGVAEISMAVLEAVDKAIDRAVEPALDDLFLSEESSVVEFVSEGIEPSAASPVAAPAAADAASLFDSDDINELDELLELDDLDELGELEALGALPPADSSVVSDDELLFDDADIVEVNPDELSGITDAELLALDEDLDSIADDESIGALFSEMSFADEPRQAAIAATTRSGLVVNSTAFGERSLSQKFNARALTEDYMPSGPMPNFFNAVNSNLELGASYRNMGRYEEAIEEFRQALDDPDAALTARYHIALCQLELGQQGEARTSLEDLLRESRITIEIRQIVESKLRQIA
jgi:pilus assembly protein FimV